MPALNVRYFAIFREQAGMECEKIVTQAETAGALYEELRKAHHCSLPRHAIRVAINNEFGSMDAPLQENDEIAFIAPVAGG